MQLLIVTFDIGHGTETRTFVTKEAYSRFIAGFLANH